MAHHHIKGVVIYQGRLPGSGATGWLKVAGSDTHIDIAPRVLMS